MSDRSAAGVPAPGELAGVAWHISTRSSDGGGSCVAAGPLADGSGRAAVRHSPCRTKLRDLLSICMAPQLSNSASRRQW